MPAVPEQARETLHSCVSQNIFLLQPAEQRCHANHLGAVPPVMFAPSGELES